MPHLNINFLVFFSFEWQNIDKQKKSMELYRFWNEFHTITNGVFHNLWI